MPKRRILAAGSTPARKAARATLGSLPSLTVEPGTSVRYARAVATFVAWLILYFGLLPENLEELDDFAQDYLAALWFEGEPRNLAADTLSGLQHMLRRRRILSGSWRLLNVWVKYERPVRTPPLSVEMALAMISLFLEYNFLDMAVLTALAFSCMLRTEEALQSRKQHFSWARKKCVLRVVGKSENRYGTTSDVIIECELTLALLRAYLKLLDLPDLLLRRSAPHFRKLWAWGIRALSLPPDLKPYALRRGGATYEWTTHSDVGRLTTRGRWNHFQTARLYAVAGQELEIQSRLTDEMKSKQQYWMLQLPRLLKTLE